MVASKGGRSPSESWQRPGKEWNYSSEPCLILKCQLEVTLCACDCCLNTSREGVQITKHDMHLQGNFLIYSLCLVPRELMTISRMFLATEKWQHWVPAIGIWPHVTISRSLKNTNPSLSEGFSPSREKPFQMIRPFISIRNKTLIVRHINKSDI